MSDDIQGKAQDVAQKVRKMLKDFDSDDLVRKAQWMRQTIHCQHCDGEWPLSKGFSWGEQGSARLFTMKCPLCSKALVVVTKVNEKVDVLVNDGDATDALFRRLGFC